MSANCNSSTGLRNAQQVATKTALTGGFLDLYGGTIPASADAAIGSATLLCTLSGPSGAGLTFAATPIAAVLSKNASQVWAGVNITTGDATFYRLRTASDSGTATTTEARIQGTVGVTGEGINLTLGVHLTSGVTTTLDSYAYELPTNS